MKVCISVIEYFDREAEKEVHNFRKECLRINIILLQVHTVAERPLVVLSIILFNTRNCHIFYGAFIQNKLYIIDTTIPSKPLNKSNACSIILILLYIYF